MASVLTLVEVADYLRVHPSTIYRLLKNHQIPAFRIGSDWRFNRESIDSWRVQAEHSPEFGVSANGAAAVSAEPEKKWQSAKRKKRSERGI